LRPAQRIPQLPYGVTIAFGNTIVPSSSDSHSPLRDAFSSLGFVLAIAIGGSDMACEH